MKVTLKQHNITYSQVGLITTALWLTSKKPEGYIGFMVLLVVEHSGWIQCCQSSEPQLYTGRFMKDLSTYCSRYKHRYSLLYYTN